MPRRDPIRTTREQRRFAYGPQADRAYIQNAISSTPGPPLDLTGDVDGTGASTINAVVVGLQGRPLSAAAPTATDVLTWDGTNWEPSPVPGGTGSGSVTSVAAGTGLTASPSPIVGAGTISLTVPVSVANGGTGASTVGGSPFLPLTGGTLSGPGNLTMAGNLYTGTAAGSGAASLELGQSRTADGFANIDLHSSAASDYDLRIQRNAGVNGDAVLTNVGTGAILLTALGGAHSSRGFFGDGTFDSSWVETLRGGATSWTALVGASSAGGPPIQIGVIGAMRSSDPTIAGARMIIGVEGMAINDNTTIVHSAWGGYFEAWRKAGCASGSVSVGVEIDIAECNSGVTSIIEPYAADFRSARTFFPANFSAALWLASGANLQAEIGVPIYPASVAIGILDNGAIFRKGIVFKSTALDTAIGAGGNGVAIEMARGQSLRWLNSGGTTDAEMWGDATGLHMGSITGDFAIGGNLYTGSAAGTGAATIEVGQGRAGAGVAFVDLHASVGSDYDLRLYRAPGVNGGAELTNAGTGTLTLTAAGGVITSSDLYVHGNANPTVAVNATYTGLNAPDGVGKVILGVAADPTNYHRNSVHSFQDRPGTTTFGYFSGAGLTLTAPLSVANGGTGATTAAAALTALGAAPLNAPVFTGDARAVTPATADSDTSIATTAYVKAQNYLTASGISGMTAGQIPVAATATTITSSGNLSGAVTTSGSLATTLANNAVATAHITNAAVTYAKVQNVANNRLLGNTSGSAAAPSEIVLPLAATLGGTGDAGTAWTAYTPTVTAATGTFTTVSATGRYKSLGKTWFVEIYVTITTNGTAAGSVRATLPTGGDNPAANFILVGRENVAVGNILQCMIYAGSGFVAFFTATNGYPAGSGYALLTSGSYEVV